ncbi:hypothetical protein GCM10009416_43360 [Craurococcus roseus]|uniref:GNAT family N-acetyltransferase n=1 Tax=Craurococcus roseus TaxID=77585 RepID=A0ABP3R514_9PROT
MLEPTTGEQRREAHAFYVARGFGRPALRFGRSLDEAGTRL